GPAPGNPFEESGKGRVSDQGADRLGIAVGLIEKDAALSRQRAGTAGAAERTIEARRDLESLAREADRRLEQRRPWQLAVTSRGAKAASSALPPCRSISAPASAARGSAALTMPGTRPATAGGAAGCLAKAAGPVVVSRQAARASE